MAASSSSRARPRQSSTNPSMRAPRTFCAACCIHSDYRFSVMNAHSRLPLPPSLYADTAVAPVSTPPLDTDRNVPVAIIGGGFTGLSTALHLAEQGVQATVLEAQEPGWGASGNNGGQVNPGLKHDPDKIEADFGAELGRRMIEFSYGTTNFTLDLICRYQIPCE